MSSFNQFLKRTLTQTIVYWGSPVNDGYGGYTFASPVEIKGRWDSKIRKVKDSQGEEIVSEATISLLQDVDINGFLYLGSLSDLTVQQQSNPMLVDSAYKIQYFTKLPLLGSTNEFLRIAYVRPN